MYACRAIANLAYVSDDICIQLATAGAVGIVCNAAKAFPGQAEVAHRALQAITNLGYVSRRLGQLISTMYCTVFITFSTFQPSSIGSN